MIFLDTTDKNFILIIVHVCSLFFFSPSFPLSQLGWMVPWATQVKRAVGLPVACVGLIADPVMADSIIREGKADIVNVGRAMLRNPAWANMAAQTLGVECR